MLLRIPTDPMQANEREIQTHETQPTDFTPSKRDPDDMLIPCLSTIMVKSIGEDNGNSNKVSQTGKIFMVGQVFNGNTCETEDTTMIL